MNNPIQSAISDLQQGKMVLLVDDHDREDEADLVMAGEFVRPDDITFMRDHSCGIICLSMTPDYANRLQIPPMRQQNQSRHQTPFGVSFEASAGITTGVSSADRAHSIRVAANPNSGPSDIVMPGHIFPLLANKQGVFARPGHTEGSTDLLALAKLSTAAVICELMNSDGTMTKGAAVKAFADRHQLTVVTIEEVKQYRLKQQAWLHVVSESALSTRYGDFKAIVFRSEIDGAEHIAICSTKKTHEPWVRIHSECLTGDVFGSSRCDCGQQLDLALRLISEQGGAVFYCRQEGRGIGLANKIKSYALQDRGMDTVEANHHLGFAADCREYSVAIKMLEYFKWNSIHLLTNNPDKMQAMEQGGINVVSRVPIHADVLKTNHRYLSTKRDKLGHQLNLESTAC